MNVSIHVWCCEHWGRESVKYMKLVARLVRVQQLIQNPAKVETSIVAKEGTYFFRTGLKREMLYTSVVIISMVITKKNSYTI